MDQQDALPLSALQHWAYCPRQCGLIHLEHALPLWHDGLGLIGKADVVEFDKAGRPYPVEYKHGSSSQFARLR